MSDSPTRSSPAPEIQIVIPSHRRAGSVFTSRLFPPGAYLICVPESQYRDYAANHPKRHLVAHPDSVVGINAKRQWIYEQFKNVLMMDDDIKIIMRNNRQSGYVRKTGEVHRPRPKKVSPERFVEYIHQVRDTAWYMGASLWGIGSCCNPMSRGDMQPFNLGGHVIGACLGLFEDPNLFFPKETTLPICDLWISLLNAHHNRFAFVDWRFGHLIEGMTNTSGGMAEFRQGPVNDQSYALLHKNFGEACFMNERNEPQMRLPYRYR